MFKPIALALLISLCSTAGAVSLGSKHAMVIDEETGAVLLEKNSTDIVPIASLTKLMTAMVVLDANLDMAENITITDADVDVLKHSSSRVPVGAVLTRGILLELALMSSDNRAAFALARTYPGGMTEFRNAVRNKAHSLNLRRTNIEEPTGLSRFNTSTAADMAKLAIAASKYPDIEKITTAAGESIDVDGTATRYNNTNRLVSDKKWTILLSKTGFTNEAGRCIIMRVRAAGRNAIMVLLNARESVIRTADATRLHRLLTGEPEMQVAEASIVKQRGSKRIKGKKGKAYASVALLSR
ncbi:MAG: serine hydrolase [Herminiimonas sp.]|nr:serine hydrolase [Herminiimonas sp.]